MKIFMEKALREAQKAADLGEIPVGAVIVKDGKIISCAHNSTGKTNDPTAHAELLAIRKASKALSNSRLIGCEMYVTLEPCAMCAGAIVLSRLKTIHIGTLDPKSGACGSVLNILQDQRLNHFVQVNSGLLENECSTIIKNFFKIRREENKINKKKAEEK